MDEKIKRRGPGQPVKKVPRGTKRVQVSMILSAELKTRIDAVAKRDGRTFSQTGDQWRVFQSLRVRGKDRELKLVWRRIGKCHRLVVTEQLWRSAT